MYWLRDSEMFGNVLTEGQWIVRKYIDWGTVKCSEMYWLRDSEVFGNVLTEGHWSVRKCIDWGIVKCSEMYWLRDSEVFGNVLTEGQWSVRKYIDWGTVKCSERNLTQCQFLLQIQQATACNRTTAFGVRGWPHLLSHGTLPGHGSHPSFSSS
jgi:hypothetical protein